MKSKLLKWAIAVLTVMTFTGFVGIASADDHGQDVKNDASTHHQEEHGLKSSISNPTTQNDYRAKVQTLLETAF